MSRIWVTRSSIFTLLLFAVLLLFWLNDPYFFHVMIMTCLNIIFVTGFRLILMTGQLTIAQGAFAAIGAYASVLFVLKAGLCFWLSMPLAGLAAASVAIIVGYPTLKIKGAYFAIMTFALGEVIRLVFVNWENLFGGSSGIIDIPAPDRIIIPGLLKVEFATKGSYFLLALLLMVISVLVMQRIEKSRIGLLFQAISQSDALSESIGINIMSYKVMAFAVGSFFAGIGGAVYAHYIHYLNPHSFSFHESINWIMFCVVGGVSSMWGPIIGSIFFTWLPEVLRATKHLETLISSIILISVVLFMPDGLISLHDKFKGWFNSVLKTWPSGPVQRH